MSNGVIVIFKNKSSICLSLKMEQISLYDSFSFLIQSTINPLSISYLSHFFRPPIVHHQFLGSVTLCQHGQKSLSPARRVADGVCGVRRAHFEWWALGPPSQDDGRMPALAAQLELVSHCYHYPLNIPGCHPEPYRGQTNRF